jgi:hypothetical protein
MDVIGVDRQCPLRITALQGAQRRVPGDVAVKDAAAVVARQPALDKPFRLLVRTALVQGVRERMRRVGVVLAQVVAALRQRPAMRHVAVLRMRPAPVGEKPPVVGVEVPGVALAEIHARLVVVRHAGEGEEPEGAERQRQDQHIPRPSVGVHERPLQGFGRMAVDAQRQDRHMAALPLGPAPGDDLFRRRDPRLGLGHLRPDHVQAGAGRMSEGKVRVGRDGLVQHLGGAGPGRKQQVDAFPVAFGCAVGRGREWQATAVEADHGRSSSLDLVRTCAWSDGIYSAADRLSFDRLPDGVE